ncbi:RagB/SusD family nutrient uptake outer membrane protein [Chitinophaga sp. CF418]|uniref:RagB/SusD family nutrient uptake outer membrane protein n=1 Tax=Chitinophaga sp. CF418 TaxID=1855287 RepID=UPI00165FE0D8|nr:RagB/SusD family nutrient uptake outer membrane protein [Chitinophaga sp. CF418]
MKTKGTISLQYKRIALSLLACFGLLTGGCKKLADVDTPINSTSTENVYKDNSTASAVFIGLYSRISARFFNGGLASLSVYGELSADNLSIYDINTSRSFARYYRNDLEPTYADETSTTYWQTVYQLLYTVNDAIANLNGNAHLSPKVASRLLGEAYFLRAFCYFYLVNLYGDVPLILTTDPEANAKAGRTSTTEVYAQMNNDLSNAEALLTQDYVPADVTKTTNERLRPNLAAVHALQARVFLYQKNYSAAESAATKVIEQSDYFFTELNNTFLKNSPETIWALQSVTYGINTFANRYLLITDIGLDGSDNNFYLSESLLNNFEAGDQRKTDWVRSIETNGKIYYYPTKYRSPVIAGSTVFEEYDIVLRLSEQYLIRAEARNEQNNIAGAIADLNMLRDKRRGPQTPDVGNPLPAISLTVTQQQLRPLILKERRSELYTEWGHRWFDLKRSGTIDAVMSVEVQKKDATWSSYKGLFPIPTSEIFVNRALTQNTGYIN